MSGRDASGIEPLDATGPNPGPAGIDVLGIPANVLCVVNALAGEVWFADRSPQRQWLVNVEADAIASSDENELRRYPGRVS